ncbi:MAG TPA: transposase [Fontimonas sp.]
MTEYRRAFTPGGSYFFTVNLAQRHHADLLLREIGTLRDAVRRVRQSHPFAIVAAVVLPDHLHMIWRLPEADADYPRRWQLIKGHFSRALKIDERRSASRLRKRERGIWQRRYWEHLIRDDDDLCRHVEYIHYNPVKHGHVMRPYDWPHSSFRRYVRQRLYPADWGASAAIRGLELE